MTDFKVMKFPNGSVSEDGGTITVEFETDQKERHTMTMPYGQFEWLFQGLLQLSAGAYERQVSSGRIHSKGVGVTGFRVESFRTEVNKTDGLAALLMIGRPMTTGSQPAMNYPLVLDEAQLRDLSKRLLAVADQLKQTSNPS